MAQWTKEQSCLGEIEILAGSSQMGEQPVPSAESFDWLARTALAQYPIEAERTVFLQHNGGITYFIESSRPRVHFLLKIHVPVGAGESPRPEHMRARLLWLDDLHATTGMAVQIPVRNRQGDVITLIAETRRTSPYPCTMQHWVEGEPPRGHLTVQQVFEIGRMMARLHAHSSRWVPPADPSAVMPDAEVDDGGGATAVHALRVAVDLGMLTSKEFETIIAADQIINTTMQGLSGDRQVCGPIHGDLNHRNLLFDGDEVRPIDFDSMCVAPYSHDLGVTMYHILYQERTIRAALLAGYQAVRVLPAQPALWLEASVTWAAMNNLAFQITIPEQLSSPVLYRNLRQLANDFCAKLIAGQAFVLS
jgi:Ser/Thr protein kinase RdoA (MazF antagonist)